MRMVLGQYRRQPFLLALRNVLAWEQRKKAGNVNYQNEGGSKTPVA